MSDQKDRPQIEPGTLAAASEEFSNAVRALGWAIIESLRAATALERLSRWLKKSTRTTGG